MAAADDQKTAPDLGKQSTIAGLEKESDVSFYHVGLAIKTLSMNLLENLKNSDPKAREQVIKLGIQKKVESSLISSIAFVCRADGKLGEKEEAALRWMNKDFVLTEDELKECLKGKEAYKEACDAHLAALKIFAPNMTDIQEQAALIGFKKEFILATLVACAQDGLVKEEYTQAKIMANKLGLKDEDVKECVGLLKMEIEMAKKLKSFLTPI